MKRAAIIKNTSFLPSKVLDNDALSQEFKDWDVKKIYEKTGIFSRRIAGSEECSSDLGVAAAYKLFESGVCHPQDIDFLLFCTQSPDYYLPTTACLIQDRLKLKTTCGALDFNLGCSGFIYGLSLAKGLIETNQARNVLLITAETYSKFIDPNDRSVRTIFGDGAAATLISAVDFEEELIGPFVFGTDGRGAEKLIVPAGGLRNPPWKHLELKSTDKPEYSRSDFYLYMDGPEILNFTLREIPQAVNQLIQKSELSIDDIDYFIFHQANKFLLENLRKKLKIPPDKFCINMEYYGNTVSASIPMALELAVDKGEIKPGKKVMLVGFGVGYSWGATIVKIPLIN